MLEYDKVNVKLSNSKVNKVKTTVKNRQDLTLTMNIKMFNWNNLSHEFLLITRQKSKFRNALILSCLELKYLN